MSRAGSTPALELPSGRCPRLLQPLACRPHLLISTLLGLGVYVVTGFWMQRAITRALIGWDVCVLAFLGFSFLFMMGRDHERMKRRAIAHDEGRHLMLVLTTLAAVASVYALMAELSAAKGHPEANLRVVLAAGTVVLSWLFVQTVFAIHYTHVYYLEGEGGCHRRGLEFGDEEEPDYWDFFHFSIVMGATAQTADIVIRSKEIRRVGTLHTLVAFGFNTAILATMINLAANLI